tara:strand:+ start:1137 stop:1841 length:705 start_codon:yes stop_codon:yes gene_type:complete
MSTIDPNSTATLNKILEKIGVKSNDETSLKKKETLGQSDFLKLMTTQLQNQDPFAPMENGDFIAQMAQFSTVTGIAEMGESLKSLSNQLGEFRIATATNLLGHSVLVPGNKVRPNSDGEIHGVLDIPRASSATNIVFSNTAGEVVHTIDLGSQASGLVGFSWNDIPQELRNQDNPLKIEAFMNGENGRSGVTPSVFAEVLAASTGDSKTGVVLEVKDYGNINAADVTKFRSNNL